MNKWIGALAAAALWASSPGLTAAPAEGSRAELLHVADAFDRAQLAKDRATLERMVADELVFIEGSGKRSGKTEFISGWTTPGERYDPITLVDRVVTPLGPDAFMVSAETVLNGTSDGKPFQSAIRYTDTFRRIDGQWRAVHIQVTPIPRRN